MTTSAPPLSITIGGRVVSPALPIVDASPPTAAASSFDKLLSTYSDEHIPLEPTEGIQRRERVLDRMRQLCREWIRSVCLSIPLPAEAVENAGGQLYTSGSYRLGVHEPGADIDTILVAPNVCSREDFFGSGYIPPDYDGESDLSNVRDPNSLAERIKAHPDVTNFVPVENAAVPILTFDWEGVNIDLLFARLNSSSVPRNFDIDNDAVLDGVDSATEKSLNGPRTTNLIAALVRGTDERYQTFLKVVRCVRKWAKARGLYSNKMGYWGGVNINISVALVLQLYPNDCAASVLRKFFLVFKSWRWPNPVMLTKPHDAGYGLPIWNAYHVNLRQVAPVITPAYPAMNSTISVSRQTLQILHEEFCRGHDIMDKLWKAHINTGMNNEEGQGPMPLESEAFGELFTPSDFYISYPHYLSVCIVGPTEQEAQSWTGFVESRLRHLVSNMLGKSLPLSKIQLWPKKVEACVADRTSLLTHDQRKNSTTYFIGFAIDLLRMRGNQLNLEQQLQFFSRNELGKFQPHIPGMDVLSKYFKVKELPVICFDGMYDGGKLEAMKKRRRIRDVDPRRVESKKLARLAEIKSKMEEMRKKKEALASKKRKREKDENEKGDEEEGEGGGSCTKIEEGVGEGVENASAADATSSDAATPLPTESEAVAAIEEETLLENALDAIQNETGEGKTREEAERDRQKLLAGELLAEGGGDDGEGLAYGPDGVRLAGNTSSDGNKTLSIAEREAEVLRRSGYNVVSDDEVVAVGSDFELPWRKKTIEPMLTAKKEDTKTSSKINGVMKVKFKTTFDVVELDEDGFVIDKGDDDFSPTPKWRGRRPGFEFKLGERGLGYYRTGAKVVCPSNTSY
mmetsp:Transcript_28060/g.42996  ORF Transcript_28060/g.42996 Transcript_28060/m.42996 type:complete len:853 (-) Transcript_28060:191-2749(-)|eukprot:CAMPEP_0194095056 /NCGR_PEP_ID=MMETSP0149-20130528/56627_1 /TAXON_ID=122233 /ORGANISM="Chaetoceros debilis, Strain MM31A-1" /LENGTH=852 /DNA_ID=CAMNT_0038780987 /DNA_START=34 /DNA_END=2592 /DNA_ORIENTATION=-